MRAADLATVMLAEAESVDALQVMAHLAVVALRESPLGVEGAGPLAAAERSGGGVSSEEQVVDGPVLARARRVTGPTG